SHMDFLLRPGDADPPLSPKRAIDFLRPHNTGPPSSSPKQAPKFLFSTHFAKIIDDITYIDLGCPKHVAVKPLPSTAPVGPYNEAHHISPAEINYSLPVTLTPRDYRCL